MDILACDLGALDASQRERHAALGRVLAATRREVRDLADGFAYRHDGEGDLIVQIAEWITLERRCCPFLTFRLALEARGDLWLTMTGPPGTKAVLGGAAPPASSPAHL